VNSTLYALFSLLKATALLADAAGAETVRVLPATQMAHNSTLCT